MWELTNQDIVIILSLLSGCLVFYNLWGYFIGKIIILIATIYTCIYVVINDNYNTLLAKINDNIIKAGNNIPDLFSQFYHQLLIYLHQFGDFVKKFYQQNFAKMERRGRNSYQLSSESSINMSNNSQLGLVGTLSPISKNTRRSVISGSENSVAKHLLPSSSSSSFGGNKQWENSNYHLNGDLNGSMQHLWKKSPTKYSNNDTQDDSLSVRREEILFRSHSTPWNAGLSDKNNSNTGIKTVQTVAGPLLSSSRYNIDSKAYSTLSPGRLTKYASDANTRLLYQSQYSTGQFPKVNLYCSPTPTVNAKTVKARSPVTVRIAPPETIKYSPPEKQKLLAAIYHSVKKSPQSAVKVFKEIPLKRHASMDDFSILELVKRQRTNEASLNEVYKSFDEGTQKRTREDLSKSEDDISIENRSLRPVKRTRIPSCNDILSSLSSSTNVVTGNSGVKRKADLSRSGTPEVGKHFKSFDSNRRSNSLSPRAIVDKSTSMTSLNRSSSAEYLDAYDDRKNKKQDADSPKQISQRNSPNSNVSIVNNNSKLITQNSLQPTLLKDKLFMRAEPQNIDKIKTLIEEHDLTSKFGGDDADEIKQSDILTMRQTSMKARLKSMFDAISGKASGEIDPNVVIQADENNDRPTSTASTVVTSTAQSQPVLTLLNSSTSTTNVNTSPIATSAIKPIIGKSKDSNTPVKRVTFNLSGDTTPTNSTSLNVSSSVAPSLQQKSDDGLSKPTSPNLSFFQQKSPVSASSFSLTTVVATPVTSTVSNSLKTITTASTTPGFSLTQVPASTVAVQPVIQKTDTIISSSFNLQKQVPASTSSLTLPSPSPSTGFSFGKPGTVATTIPSVNPVSQASSALTTSANTFANNQITATAPAFSFGSNVSTATTGFSFGNTSTSSALQTAAKDNATPAFNAVKSPVNSTSTPSLFSFTPTVSTSISNPATVATPTTLATSSTTPGSSAGFNFEAAKPTFSFGNSSSPQVTTTASLGFNSTSQSMPVFGNATTANTQVTPSFAASHATSQTTATTTSSLSTVMFGANTSTQSSFSSPANTNTKPSILSFVVPKTTEVSSFGGNKPAITASSLFNGANPTSSSTSSLMFGGNNNSNNNTNTNTNINSNVNANTNNNNNNIFGQTKLPSFGSQPNLSFGTNSNPTFGNNSTMTFGSQQTTTTASFGTTTPATDSTKTPTFGSSSSVATPAFGGTSTSSTSFSGFGNTNTSFGTQNKSSLNTSAVFGNAATSPPPFGATATTAPPSFGATPTTAPPAFGATTTATPAFGSSTNSVFGATTTALPAFGASTTSAFGASAAPPPAFGPIPTTAPPAFGTTTAPPTFGSSTTTPSFGTSTSTSAFGSSSSAVKPTFSGSTAPPAFGATSTSVTPSFGGSSAATPSFGSSSSSTAGPPAFGASTAFGSSSTPAFGSTNSSFSSFGTNSTPSPFALPAPPAFGSTTNNSSNINNNNANSNNNSNNNNNPNTSSSTFGFGNTNPASAPQNSVFSFGGPGTGSSSAGSASTPFQFGNASTPTGGFNFNGGSFNAGSNAAGGGGMFSIGSGSTAPRSRPARSRRQQR